MGKGPDSKVEDWFCSVEIVGISLTRLDPKLNTFGCDIRISVEIFE